ncbi:MAG TPA: SPOR domain-containing protein [Melioribacteraceae bacterium]|nr:SPOR domain-containing protein [Melioribacteraceae bacterium]
MFTKGVILFLFLAFGLYAQEIDISEQLKQIKNGDIEKAEKSLKEFKLEAPDNPSVIFLDALLTKDGNLALARYNTIINKYPKSTFADASVYCVFSYHYSLGNYKKAEEYLIKLKTEYPNSKYIQNADRNLNLKPDTDKEITKTIIPTIKEIKPGFTIQTGAFISLEKAKELETKLFKQGFKTKIKEKNVGGTIFNLVMAGEYAAKEDANKDVEKINKMFSLSSRVVEIDN